MMSMMRKLRMDLQIQVDLMLARDGILKHWRRVRFIRLPPRSGSAPQTYPCNMANRKAPPSTEYSRNRRVARRSGRSRLLRPSHHRLPSSSALPSLL